jgi:hypothetical protein
METSCKTNPLVGRGEDLEDREKSNHKFMANFKNSFQRPMQKKQLLDQDKYDVETENFNDSSSFMDWNQPPKSDKDDAG